jgi:hypothetical protein
VTCPRGANAWCPALAGCNPGWGGQSSYPAGIGGKFWGKTVIDAALAKGIRPIVSFGGAAGRDISTGCGVQGESPPTNFGLEGSRRCRVWHFLGHLRLH